MTPNLNPLVLLSLLFAVATPTTNFTTTNFTTTRSTLIHELFGLGPGVLPRDKVPLSVEPIPGPHMQHLLLLWAVRRVFLPVW